MKPTPPIALATWMLEHLTFGSTNESLAGDLLEELRSGRSAGWYWRQALSAIVVSLSSRSRAYVLPLVFSTGWSFLYPALWPSIMSSRPAQTMLERMAAHDWLYSSFLQVVRGVLPAMMFVWIGFFVYLMSRNQMVRQLTTLRVLVSLSLSFNVFFVATIGQHLIQPIALGRNVPQESSNSTFVTSSVPLALSLFSALVCGLPALRRRRRGADSLAG
jgi:hypothetical protein